MGISSRTSPAWKGIISRLRRRCRKLNRRQTRNTVGKENLETNTVSRFSFARMGISQSYISRLKGIISRLRREMQKLS